MYVGAPEFADMVEVAWYGAGAGSFKNNLCTWSVMR